MKEYSGFIIVFFSLVGLLIIGTLSQKDNLKIAAQLPKTNIDNFNNEITEKPASNSGNQRVLRLSVVVDSPNFLKVKEGDEIKSGQIITDNSIERERLKKQRKSLELQYNNLKSKNIPIPFNPKNAPDLAPVPKPNFLEEESAIAQAQLKFEQAQQTLNSRAKLLQTDNPQARAEVEKAEAAYRISNQKVSEQEELLRSLQDMKLEAAVIRHEEAKLKEISSDAEQARSALDQARAKLEASAIEQNQELQSLQLAVDLAVSNVKINQSRLNAAKSDRKLLEYRVSVDVAQRIEQQNQAQLSYSRQSAEYAQQVRDRDYQLAQIHLSATAIDDKLSQIPVVRSPKEGYIRRIKPWVGNNGKYQTTVIITNDRPTNILRGRDGDRRSETTSSTAADRKN